MNQKHNGEGDIRILCKHHSRADARNSYEVGSRLEMNMENKTGSNRVINY